MLKIFARRLASMWLLLLAVPWLGGAEQRGASGYDEALAERLVNYAGASYCAGQQAVVDWNCYACKKVPGFQQITSVHDPKTDGRGLVGFDTVLGARVVAFMGTNANIRTWIDDILLKPLSPFPDCKNCSVHGGFYNTYKGLREQVYTALQALPPGKTYVTGHSLGATLATHCALDLSVNRGYHVDGVITVGQPRVGNPAFADYYDSLGISHYRVTHHRDPIPHLAYEWMGYRHISNEVYYTDATKSGPTKLCSGQEDPMCADQFNGNLIFLTDHWEYLKLSFLEAVISCTLQDNTFVV